MRVFVAGLFDLNNSLPEFKEHLRDFLVQIRVWRRINEYYSGVLPIFEEMYLEGFWVPTVSTENLMCTFLCCL